MADYFQRALMALGTVFTNRLVDSRMRTLPALAAAPLYLPEIPTVQVAIGLSSSIAFLYYQLREGNMVNVGSIVSNTDPVSQNRLRNSWLLRNLNSYRRCCQTAVSRILRNPRDSSDRLRTETRNRCINTFDSAEELRHRDSLNRRTIRRRGRPRRRRRSILGIARVRRQNTAQLCAGGDARCRTLEDRPTRTRSATRSEQATETTFPTRKKIVRNKAQQVASGTSIPIGANGGIVKKTRSGKIYGCI